MMKRLSIVWCLAALAVAACGGNNSTGPSNQPTVFTVQLSALNEVPPVSNAESTARGTAVITVTTTKDSAGTVTGSSINFNVNMNGFPNGSSAILAHIHPGAAGTNGGVLVNTGLTAGTAIQMPSGSGTFNLTANGVSAENTNAILANPQNFYFNVHSPLNPGGVMRGQLR
jgi:hypothetical protein